MNNIANEAVNASLNQNNINNNTPPLEDVFPPPQDIQSTAYTWNQYWLDPMAMDATEAIMLPLLFDDTKFVISSGLLQMMQNRGLFTDLPSENPHNYLHNIVFVQKSMTGS